MGYFLDCGLLVFYSFLSLFFLPPGAGFLIFFELCKCDLLRICGEKEGIAANPLHFVRISGTGCSRDLYLYPCLFICFFMKKMGLAAVAVLFFLWKIPESRENMGLFAMTGVFGFLLAFLWREIPQRVRFWKRSCEGPRMIPRSETCFCPRKIKLCRKNRIMRSIMLP